MWNKFKKYKIVQLARVPCANSGYHLSNLINNYSQYFESRYILGSHYSKKMMNVVPFRLFPYDLFWEEQKDLCFKVIQEADIIHIHHGFYCDEDWMINLLKDKKVVTTIYDLSLIDNQNYFNRKRKISNLLTIADQPAQKRVFQGISDVLCPLVNYLYNDTIELKYNDKPIIIYAPTNRYPRNNGSSKGYFEVTQIIKELQDEKLNFEFDLIEGLSYAENIERKKKGDIFIDDIINETWHNTCYSEDTQLLTNQGWKYFKDLKGDELVLTLNPNNNNIELLNPLKIINNNYEGKMYNIKTNVLDLLITPNHKIPFLYNSKDSNIKLKEIRNIKHLSRFDMPVYGKLKNFDFKDNYKNYNIKYYLQLLGLYIADGYSSEWTLNFRFKKERKIKLLINILNKLNIKYKKVIYKNNITMIRILKKEFDLYDEFRNLGKVEIKRVPKWIFSLSPNIIAYFLFGFIQGDGNYNFKKQSLSISSCNYNLINDFQLLFRLCGRCSHIYKRFHPLYKNIVYVLHLRKEHRKSAGKKYIQEIDYKGKVYCVEMPKNHIIYVKRNEHCIWSGNSLEATFFGAIPITSYTDKDYPFIYANLKTLKEVLKFYITHPNELREKQIELIKWRKEFLNPQRLIKIYENIYFSLFKTKEEKLEKITNLPLKIMKKESSLEFMDIICKLNEFNIKFCVLNETCLYAAKFKDFKDNVKEINLGLLINNKIIELFKNLGWSYDGINFTKNNLKIYINSLPNSIKQWNIKNISINVPMPLVGYLDRLYGKD